MRLTLAQKYMLGLKMLGMTNTQLAKELNFSKQYISQLIKCQRKNEIFSSWMNKNVLPLFGTQRSFK